MSIDERIAALKKSIDEQAIWNGQRDRRMDGVVESVELLSHMQRKTEQTLERFEEFVKLVLSNHETRMRSLENGGDPR